MNINTLTINSLLPLCFFSKKVKSLLFTYNGIFILFFIFFILISNYAKADDYDAEITSISVSSNPTVGQAVEIVVSVKNTGTLTGSYKVYLKIIKNEVGNDPEVFGQWQTIWDIPAGQTSAAFFYWTPLESDDYKCIADVWNFPTTVKYDNYETSWFFVSPANDPPTATISSPSSPVSLEINIDQTFTVSASDPNGDLDLVDWYKNGTLTTTHNSGFNGSNDTDSWTTNFSQTGYNWVTAIVYDEMGNYASVDWTVNVTPAPVLSVSPASNYGFGSIGVNDCSDYIEYYTVENTGGGNLHVTVSENSSHFQIASNDQDFNLSGGQSKDIAIKFCPLSSGNKSTNIDFDGENVLTGNNVSGSPQTRSVLGTGVVPYLTVTPGSGNTVQLGSIVVGDCSGWQNAFTVYNDGMGTMNVSVSESSSNFQIHSDDQSFSLTGGQLRDLRVKLCPQSEGLKSATLTITAPGATNSPQSRYVEGTGLQPILYVEPGTGTPKNFGSITTGNCSDWQPMYTVYNDGQGAMPVTVSENSTHFQVYSDDQSFTLNTGESRVIDGKFCPNATGSLSTSLSITASNATNSPQTRTLQGTGLHSLLVTSNNIDGTCTPIPGNNGHVLLYDNNNQLQANTTTINGIATFDWIPQGTDFYYEVKNIPPPGGSNFTIFGEEYWGKEEGVTIFQTQQNNQSFTRKMPYAVDLKVFADGQDVTGQTVTGGTELTIQCTIKNPANSGQSHNVKAHLVIDEDGNQTYLYEGTSNYQNVGINQTASFSFTWTASLLGQIGMCLGTKTEVNGSYIYTDGWGWNTYITIEPSLVVTVNNFDGTSTPVPDDDGRLLLYPDGNTNWIASVLTDNGVATVDIAPSGGYFYDVKYEPTVNNTTIFGPELWGRRTGLNLTSTQVSETFDRKMPYIPEQIKIFNGNQEVTYQEVEQGTPLTVKAKVMNPGNSGQTLNVKSNVIFDCDETGTYEYELLSSAQNISSGTFYEFIYNWTPVFACEYYGASAALTEIDGSYEVTHGTAWSQNPLLSVYESLGITMTEPSSNETGIIGDNININWSATGPTYTTVNLYYDTDQTWDNGNESLIEENLSRNGPYIWNTTSMSAGTYYVYGIASDGQNQQIDYADGTVTLSEVLTEFDPNYFNDFETNVGRPYLMKARLVEQGTGNPVSEVKVDFKKLENGNWVLINDDPNGPFDGGETDDDGIARCWYEPPTNGGTESVRIEWNGNNAHGAANGQSRIATINIPEYVYMVYIAGDANDGVGESLWKHFTNSIMEIENFTNVNVYVYLDRNGGDETQYNTDDWEDSRSFIVYEPTNAEDMFDWENPNDYLGHTMFYTSEFSSDVNGYDEEKSGRHATIKSFIDNVMSRNTLTNKYILVTESHAAGYNSILEDRNPYNNGVDARDFRINVLDIVNNEFPNNSIEVMGLHGCLLGDINILFEFKNNVDYLVSSANLSVFGKPLFGGLNWDHKGIVSYLNQSRTSEQIANKMVDLYSIFNWTVDEQTIAAYDLNELDYLLPHLNSLFSLLKELILDQAQGLKVYNAFNRHWIRESQYGDFSFVDLGSLLNELKEELSDNTQLVNTCNDIITIIDGNLITNRKDIFCCSWMEKNGISIPYVKDYEKVTQIRFTWPEMFVFDEGISWMEDYLYHYRTDKLKFGELSHYDNFLAQWLDVRNPNTSSLTISNYGGGNSQNSWHGNDILLNINATDDNYFGDYVNELASGLKWTMAQIDIGNGWQTLPSINEDDPENDGKDRNADGNWGFVFHSDQPDSFHNFEGNLNNENVKFRVMAIDSAHNESEWVESSVIKIDNTIPALPLFNTQQEIWYNTNPLLDIDFIDYLGDVVGGEIAEISYQLDGINENSWNLITSDGINEIQTFGSSMYTDNWKIHNTLWQNLNVTYQGQGYHYIYFKIVDAAGNEYMTSSIDDAFKFGKDIYYPSVSIMFPEENQVLNEIDVTVVWQINDVIVGLELSGVANIYHALDQDQNFTQVDPNVVSASFSGLTEGNHTVYLYAVDNAGNTSPMHQLNFSINMAINPPSDFALSTADETEFTTLQPLLEWNVSTDPDGTQVSYEFYYADNPNYYNAQIIPCGTNQYQFQSDLSDNTVYYWKVKAVDENNQVTWSDELDWYFIINTQNNAPSLFDLLDPVNESTISNLTPTLNWENSNDIDPNDTYSYTLWIDVNNNFSNPEIHNTFDNYFVIQNALDYGTTYYWKVKVVDNYGAETWSNQTDWWFTTSSEINLSPVAFNLENPIDNFVFQSTTPLLEWGNTTDPEGTNITYDLWYSNNSNFDGATVEGNLTNTQKQVGSPLNDNTIYYWKVKAKDQDNNYRWSEELNWKFIVNQQNDAPNPFGLMMPENETVPESTTPVLSWYYSYDVDPLDAISYTIWVGTDPNFQTGTFDEYTNITDISFQLTTSLNTNTVYYWKVKAIDNQGATTWADETDWWFETPDCIPVIPGAIEINQTICYGDIPNPIFKTDLPSGGDGIFAYQWQESVDNVIWVDIDGASDDTLQPGNLQQTTYYRLAVSSNGGCDAMYSNAVEIVVLPQLDGGFITQDQNICYGSLPDTLRFINYPIGGDGVYTYQWQQSQDLMNWNDISGADSTIYIPGYLSNTTYYQVKVADNCGIVYSNVDTIDVTPWPIPIAGSNDTIIDSLTYQLAGVVQNYSDYWWSVSNGDGSFNDSSLLNAIYSPGINDVANGFVTLKLHATSIIPCQNNLVDSMVLFIQSDQQINLLTGWNIMSFNKIPDDPAMQVLLSGLLSTSSIIKVIDEAGNFIQNIPGIGWLNTIGDMENTEGYYIKMASDSVVEIIGLPVTFPFEIPLQTGWNIMGYPLQDTTNAIEILQPLIDSLLLIKTISESGGFVQFIPGVGWLNTIGDFRPGEGYYINVSDDCSLIFSINTPELTTDSVYSITHNSAVVSCTISSNGGASVLSKGVCWSTSPNPTLGDNYTNDGGGSSAYVSNMNGLDGNTTYYIRAYAANRMGINYGNEIIFSTIPAPFVCGDTLYDSRDGQGYSTVVIGGQCWMAENLNIGTEISSINNQTDNGVIEKYCYDDNSANCTNYGGLYQWNEMMQYLTTEGVQGICPDGWHLPTDDEWKTLEMALGMSQSEADDTGWRGTDEGGKMKEIGTTHWYSPNTGATNTSGFTARPGGWRHNDGSFNFLGSYGYWWSSGEYSGTYPWYRNLTFYKGQVYRNYISKTFGFSVRCLKDISIQNQPPNQPTSPLPIDSAQNQTIDVDLSWTCSDPEGDTLTYDVYFGLDSVPTLASSVISDTMYDPGVLDPDSTYYWKIVAHDNYSYTDGEVWHFSTSIPSWQQCGDTLTDIRDGETYTTVLIGTQCWMAENLNIGEGIPASSGAATDNSIIEKTHRSGDEEIYFNQYGGLYSWNEMMDYQEDNNNNPSGVQGICPLGWHVPSLSEWQEFKTFIGDDNSGGKIKETGFTHWVDPNSGATNEYDYTALPGGVISYHSLLITNTSIGYSASLWTSTGISNSNNKYNIFLEFDDTDMVISNMGMENWSSVRCVKDPVANQFPNLPSLPIPIDSAQNQTIDVDLQWTCSDPEGDTLTYDVYFGLDSIPPLVSSAISDTIYDPGTLDSDTTYYWKIVAHDNQGNTTGGDIWQFSTLTQTPNWQCGDTIVDPRDGQSYETVLIGNQCWMSENLNIGIRIDGANDQTDNSTIEKYCHSDNDANCTTYGGLYQWREMMEYVTTEGVQGICPNGWHIPTDDEWKILEGNVDTQYGIGDPEWDLDGWRGFDIGKRLKTTTEWSSGIGTDAVGFSALPSGKRYVSSGGPGFDGLESSTYFWSSNESGYLNWSGTTRNLLNSTDQIRSLSYQKEMGHSVRCLKD